MSNLSNKQRLLNLIEIFKKETDENHNLSLEDIYEKMADKIGPTFDANMKSIKDDITALTD